MDAAVGSSLSIPTTGAARTVLNCIGNTTLLPLSRVGPANGARILLKLESENPTGSMKDRMALAMIEAAESDGRLAPGGSVVEYTAGSTGVSLSLVCGVKRYPLHIVTSDAFAQEKLDHMALLGARLPQTSVTGPPALTVFLFKLPLAPARDPVVVHTFKRGLW